MIYGIYYKGEQAMRQEVITLGGAIWINLANTIMMQGGQRTDVLKDSSSMLQWLAGNGLMAEECAEQLDAASTYRTLAQLRNICLDALANLKREQRLSAQTFSKLAEMAGTLRIKLRLERQGDAVRLIREGESLADRIRYAVLDSLIETLARYPAERIRKCEHEACMLHFVDTSKSGKRRWCSMNLCGNRHKAAHFYARSKERAKTEHGDH